MADLNKVFQALRFLPEFDGNPNVSPRFIKLCDQLVQEIVGSNNADNNLLDIALANGILNKVSLQTGLTFSH